MTPSAKQSRAKRRRRDAVSILADIRAIMQRQEKRTLSLVFESEKLGYDGGVPEAIFVAAEGKVCETCRHWERYSQGENGPIGWCRFLGHADCCPSTPADFGCRKWDAREAAKAPGLRSDSDLRAYLATIANPKIGARRTALEGSLRALRAGHLADSDEALEAIRRVEGFVEDVYRELEELSRETE